MPIRKYIFLKNDDNPLKTFVKTMDNNNNSFLVI